MNLPPPFNKAADIRINLDGSICLIDARGKVLARIPLSTAFELLREPKSRGFTRPKRASIQNLHYGYGTTHGSGFGNGAAIGKEALCYGGGHADGSGNGESK